MAHPPTEPDPEPTPSAPTNPEPGAHSPKEPAQPTAPLPTEPAPEPVAYLPPELQATASWPAEPEPRPTAPWTTEPDPHHTAYPPGPTEPEPQSAAYPPGPTVSLPTSTWPRLEPGSQEPPPPPRPHDRLAVAVANASLLSLGYLMLGRRLLAALTGLVTVALVIVLAASVKTVWFEFVVVLWWVLLIAHGWFLAGRPARRSAERRERLVALVVTVPVLLFVGFLRFDAASIEGHVTDARASGDCDQALTALNRVWVGHRVVDAPLTARGDRTVDACHRLQTAHDNLVKALNADTLALKDGYDELTSVLVDLPGHEKMVDTVLDRFLASLPVPDSCQTVQITDWLQRRPLSNNALDRSGLVVDQTMPQALLACGDNLMAAKEFEQAQQRYQRLLDLYPSHALVPKAQEGVKQARLAIELRNVRNLLQGGTATQPQYCATPAAYEGAAPYGKGTNRALFFGDDDYAGKFPGEWKAGDAADAVLIVCIGKTDFGDSVRTCTYDSISTPGLSGDVTFYKIAVPVKAYELRTGKPVVDTTVQIGGAACPKNFDYFYNGVDTGPPSQRYVDASDDDVRAAFSGVVNS